MIVSINSSEHLPFIIQNRNFTAVAKSSSVCGVTLPDQDLLIKKEYKPILIYLITNLMT